MAEDLQQVSRFLAQPPFSRKVSILDLDALSGPSGLQFLIDVFAALDPSVRTYLFLLSGSWRSCLYGDGDFRLFSI